MLKRKAARLLIDCFHDDCTEERYELAHYFKHNIQREQVISSYIICKFTHPVKSGTEPVNEFPSSHLAVTQHTNSYSKTNVRKSKELKFKRIATTHINNAIILTIQLAQSILSSPRGYYLSNSYQTAYCQLK